jgi:uncharacterized protein (TIRG00374 family)
MLENAAEKSKDIIKDDILSLEKKGKKFISKQILSLLIVLVLLSLLSIFARFTSISDLENQVFYLIYRSPNYFGYLVSGIMQFGAFLFVIVAAAIAFVYNRIKLSRDFIVAGPSAWILAKIIKDIVNRPRPIVALNDVIARSEDAHGLGYPSGHMAVVSALGFILWPYLGKKGKIIVIGIILLTGLGRMYVGAHYPLDLVGGVMVGWITASLIYLVFRFERVAKKEVIEEAAQIIPDAIQENKSHVKKILYFVLIIAGIIVLVPLLNSLPDVVKAIAKIHPFWIVPILLTSLLTYIFATIAQYGSLSYKVPFGELLLVQIGGSFANRILPAGLGGIGMNMQYLKNKGVSNTIAATSIAVKSFVAFIITFILTCISLLVTGENIFEVIKIDNKVLITVILILVICLSTVFIVEEIRMKMKKKLLESLSELKKIANPRKYFELFIGTIGITTFYTLAFYFSALAFGIDVSIFSAFIIYTLGTTLGSAVPTPGGVGGVEAALAGGLVLFGVSFDTALAAVLIYRIATFWLPTIIGAPVFFYLKRKKLV